jgi:hypothetical protein
MPYTLHLGFIQKPTFEKTGFQIFAKNVIKSKKIFTLILKYVFSIYGNTKI